MNGLVSETKVKRNLHMGPYFTKKRLKKGWSWEDLAKKSGVLMEDISSLESCSIAESEVIIAISKALGLTTVQLNRWL